MSARRETTATSPPPAAFEALIRGGIAADLSSADVPVILSGTVSSAIPAMVAGRYRVLRELARGGMGVVLEAEDTSGGATVALKLLRKDAEVVHVERFLHEARAATHIQSEHVVRVLDVGRVEENGQPFLVMELLSGEDLGQHVRSQGPLPVADVVSFAIQACDALARAHAAGIVHRDIKPSNLFRHVRSDGSVVIKVLDFGISKSRRERTLTASQSGAVLGSPPYMSPEQIRDPKRVDHRTDLWSLGVVIYRLLTNELPFDGERVGEIFAQVLSATGLPPLAPRGFPEALDTILARCVAPDPRARFGDAGDLAVALAGLAPESDGGVAARAFAVAKERTCEVLDFPRATSAVLPLSPPVETNPAITIDLASSPSSVLRAPVSRYALAMRAAALALAVVSTVGGAAAMGTFRAAPRVESVAAAPIPVPVDDPAPVIAHAPTPSAVVLSPITSAKAPSAAPKAVAARPPARAPIAAKKPGPKPELQPNPY